ncbi:MAG: hypothetical protein H7Y33_13545 [Cytophagales bacterium]|nr:hypothetical protein [Rhizobacter sp.]
MHASPAFQMTARHYGIWRLAVAFLVVAAAGAVGAWALRAAEVFPGWVWSTAVVLAMIVVATVVQAWRLRPMTLRWDTQRWYLHARSESRAGRMTVCLDLGAWMLLRFTPDGAGVLHAGTWLPLQRRGHEAYWHALRCTVYCARPVSLPTAAPF